MSDAAGPAPPVTLVDTRVPLDVALPDPAWEGWSASALAPAADDGPLVINPIIYAEVPVGYATVEELDESLPDVDCRRVPLPYRAGFLAG